MVQGPVHGVAFSPDGASIVSGGLDGVARIWNVASGSLRELEGQSS